MPRKSATTKKKKPAARKKQAAATRASKPPARKRKPGGSDDAKPATRGRGRPTTYSRAVEDRILDRMFTGQPLRVACRAVGVSATTFLTWVEDDRNGISERYARAREACFDAMAEAIIDLADDDSRDVVIDDEGKEVERPLRVNRARLQIDSRKWLLAKAMPHKYGNRVQVESEGGLGLGSVAIYYENTPDAEDLSQQLGDEEMPTQ